MFLTFFSICIVIATASVAVAADTEYPPLQGQQIQRWIAELDSPQLRVRNTAEQSLLRLGRNVEPFLPLRPTVTGVSTDLSADLSAEQGLRLDRIRKKWDTELLTVIREGVRKTATVSSNLTAEQKQCTIELDWSPLLEHKDICPIRLRFFGRTFLLKDTDEKVWCPTTPEAVLEVPMSPKQHLAVLRFPVTRATSDTTETETAKKTGIETVSGTGTWQFLFACWPYPFQFPSGISDAAIIAEFPQRKSRGDVTVELFAPDWNPNRREYIARIEVRYKTPRDSLLSYRQWPENFRPELRNNRHPTQSGFLPFRTRMIRRTENSIQSEFTFDLSEHSAGTYPLENLFLFFCIPTEIRDESLEFP